MFKGMLLSKSNLSLFTLGSSSCELSFAFSLVVVVEVVEEVVGATDGVGTGVVTGVALGVMVIGETVPVSLMIEWTNVFTAENSST